MGRPSPMPGFCSPPISNGARPAPAISWATSRSPSGMAAGGGSSAPSIPWASSRSITPRPERSWSSPRTPSRSSVIRAVPDDYDEREIAAWLASQPEHPEHSFFAAIRKLPPGHRLTAEGRSAAGGALLGPAPGRDPVRAGRGLRRSLPRDLRARRGRPPARSRQLRGGHHERRPGLDLRGGHGAPDPGSLRPRLHLRLRPPDPVR